VRAPLAGQILKIHTRVGEKVSAQGIAELGQTDRMMVVAEVYQTDVGKIQIGQTATISSQAFASEVKGTVAQIGLQVLRQNVFSGQPGENLDRRVVEVKIRLTPEDSKKVAQFTNLQVQVAIDNP
jgi:HlyD family secretion protein